MSSADFCRVLPFRAYILYQFSFQSRKVLFIIISSNKYCTSSMVRFLSSQLSVDDKLNQSKPIHTIAETRRRRRDTYVGDHSLKQRCKGADLPVSIPTSIGKGTIGIDSMHACQWRTKLSHLLPIVMLRVARLGATVRISEAIVLMRWMGIHSHTHTHTHGIELN